MEQTNLFPTGIEGATARAAAAAKELVNSPNVDKKPHGDICARKHKGNTESRLAFASKPPAARLQQRLEVFEYISGRSFNLTLEQIIAINPSGGPLDRDDIGVSAYEVTKFYGLQLSSVSARMSELKSDGHIFKIGTRPTNNNKAAGVYVVTPGVTREHVINAK